MYPEFSAAFQVKIPCGLGLAVQHGRGSLAALWPLGVPRRLPTQRETRGKLLPVQVDGPNAMEKLGEIRVIKDLRFEV